MCLYPKLILNRKYLPNKKNGGTPPKCPDERLRYVTAACGKCYECRKQKARGWLVRMEEELRHNPNAVFVTLTLEDKWYKNIEKKYNIKGDNNVATQAMRLWLERVRKITKKSIKHWCITELGGNEAKKILNDIVISGKKLTLEQQQQLLDVVLGLGGLATRMTATKGGQ